LVSQFTQNGKDFKENTPPKEDQTQLPYVVEPGKNEYSKVQFRHIDDVILAPILPLFFPTPQSKQSVSSISGESILEPEGKASFEQLVPEPVKEYAGAMKRSKLKDNTEEAVPDPVAVKMLEDLNADTFFFKN